MIIEVLIFNLHIKSKYSFQIIYSNPPNLESLATYT